MNVLTNFLQISFISFEKDSSINTEVVLIKKIRKSGLQNIKVKFLAWAYVVDKKGVKMGLISATCRFFNRVPTL